MLETSIMNTKKSIRAIKKRADELSIYHFVKVHPSTEINVITKLKTNHPMVKVTVTSLNVQILLVTE